jgi:hypothetical protein
MNKTLDKKIPFCLMFFMAIMFISAGCAEQPDMAGTYKEVSIAAPRSHSIIELKDNNEGIWETDIDEISFRWSVRDNDVWLHTKTGGLIIARITDQGFIIELPEAGSLVFHRTAP